MCKCGKVIDTAKKVWYDMSAFLFYNPFYMSANRHFISIFDKDTGPEPVNVRYTTTPPVVPMSHVIDLASIVTPREVPRPFFYSICRA